MQSAPYNNLWIFGALDLWRLELVYNFEFVIF